MRILTAPVLLLTILSLPAFAEDPPALETAGPFTLHSPPGWTRSENKANGVVSWSASGVVAGVSCTMTVLPGEETSITPAAWGAATFKKLAEGEKSSKTDSPAFRGDWSVQSGIVEGDSGSKARVVIFAIRIGKRVEAMIYISDSAKLFKKHRAAIEAMIDGATWAGKAPAAGALKAEVWRHLIMRYVPTAGGRTEAVGVLEHLTLFEDGVATTSWPEKGLRALDRAPKLAPGVHDGLGRWVREGSLVNVTWNSGYVWEMEEIEGKLFRDKESWGLVAAVDGLTLKGRFEWKGAGPLSWIELRKDGTFDGENVLALLPEVAGDERPVRGPGTYEIRDHAVEFRWASGYARTLAFDALGEDRENPSFLALHGTSFGRK